MTSSDTQNHTTTPARNSKGQQAKKLGLWGLAALFVLTAGDWLYTRSYTVSIEDARIASNIISVSSNLSGWIKELTVKSGQTVDANALLAKLDTRAAKLALQEYDLQITTQEAEILRAQAERDIREEQQRSDFLAQQARVDSARARAKKAESEHQQAQANFERANKLLAKKLIPTKQWEDAQLELRQARQNSESAKAALVEEESDLRKARAGLKTVELMDQQIAIQQRQLERLKINRDQQLLDLEDRHIRSPIPAIVDKTFVHAGEYIAPGRRLLMLHDPNDIWINANIKETMVRKVKPGMRASVHVDAYPDREFTATVDRIDTATTSEFALLPNPNPSGNFTKVTQRLRVVLHIEQTDNLLKPGMMVAVNIDTRG